MVDKIFIGYIPGVGKQDLAGVGVTAPVILAISAFAALVSMGGGSESIYSINTVSYVVRSGMLVVNFGVTFLQLK